MPITHRWNGTILTITSDSGTSSCDLKGEKGDDGCRGPQGRTGLTIGADGIIDTSGLATTDYVDSKLEASTINTEATGDLIKLNDADEKPLQGLTIYGKTTQNGTPTPETPIPLETAGNNGSIDINITGKNMASVVYTTSVKNQYSTMTTIKPIKLYAGISYVLSFDTENTGISCYINNATFSYKTFVMDGKRKTFTFTFTQDKNMEIVSASGITEGSSVLISRSSATSDVESGVISNIQIEIGAAETAYEPYEPQTLTINTPNGLAGIPVSSGGNYTDENGQQWLCDEIDLERGVYIQRVFRCENFTLSNTYTNTKMYSCYTRKDCLSGGSGVGMCNITNKYSYNTQDNIHYYISVNNNNDAAVVFTPIDYDTAANPIIVYAALTTPEETQLTAEEIAAYHALHTNKPHTTIYNDAGAGQKVKYAADIKLYIDNKFEALTNAIVSLGGNI